MDNGSISSTIASDHEVAPPSNKSNQTGPVVHQPAMWRAVRCGGEGGETLQYPTWGGRGESKVRKMGKNDGGTRRVACVYRETYHLSAGK